MRRFIKVGFVLMGLGLSACGESTPANGDSLNYSCVYNNQKWQGGESFPSSDGCNTCSCDHSGQVACTLMACAP